MKATQISFAGRNCIVLKPFFVCLAYMHAVCAEVKLPNCIHLNNKHTFCENQIDISLSRNCVSSFSSEISCCKYNLQKPCFDGKFIFQYEQPSKKSVAPKQAFDSHQAFTNHTWELHLNNLTHGNSLTAQFRFRSMQKVSSLSPEFH